MSRTVDVEAAELRARAREAVAVRIQKWFAADRKLYLTVECDGDFDFWYRDGYTEPSQEDAILREELERAVRLVRDSE